MPRSVWINLRLRRRIIKTGGRIPPGLDRRIVAASATGGGVTGVAQLATPGTSYYYASAYGQVY